MKKGISVEDLPPEIRNGLKGEADLMPDRWVIHSKVMLLLSELSLTDSYWVVNKVRHDIEQFRRDRKRQAALKKEDS